VHAERLRIGVLGAGMIATSPTGVVPNLAKIADQVELRAIASRTRSVAENVAETYAIPEVYGTLDEMLANAEVDAIVNLTPGPAHTETNQAILEGGKHLVSEKPFATTVEDALGLIELARERDLTIVVAPPSMLDPRRIAARRIIHAGGIGRVAFVRCRASHGGPASMSWPADPSWFYAEGAGSLLDIGVYGIAEVTGLIGPAKRVTAMSGITEKTRIARGGPFHGRVIDVTADDNTVMMLDFGKSTFAVIDATFNVSAARSPNLEVFGLEGTLNLTAAAWLKRDEAALEVYKVDVVPGYGGWSAPSLADRAGTQARFDSLGRAVLVNHLAECLATGLKPALSAEHATHTLEVMLAAQQSALSGCAVDLTTSFSLDGTVLG
jgi:predicted dehydrogenase